MVRCLLLLATLLLAGCASPTPPAEPVATAPQPVQHHALAWDLTDCQAMRWEVPVLASRLAGRLPDGFTPTPAQGAAVPAGVEQAASLGFEAIECATAFGAPDSAVRSVPYARLYTPVMPPAGQADHRPGVAHAFTWAILVSDDDWRGRLAALGLPVHDGATLVGASAQGFSGRLAIDTVGSFGFTGRTSGTEQPVGARPFRDFLDAATGLAGLVGTMEQRTSAEGVGVWDVSPESWVAEVVGGTQGLARFSLEHWSAPHVALIRPATGEAVTGPVEE